LPGHSDPDHDEVLGRAFDRRLARRLLTVTRPHQRTILASALLLPLTSALELVQPVLIKVAIDDHILRADWPGLGGVAALFLLTLGVLYALRAVQSYLLQVTGQRVMHDLRAALFAHLQRLDARFFDRNPVGRLMTRVLNDVEAVSEMFSSGVVIVVADVLTLVGVIVIMLSMEWRLALVTLSVIPILFAVAAYLRFRARDAYREVRTRLARLNAFLQESLQGMAIIQMFAREGREQAAFRRLNADHRRALFRSTTYDASLYASVEAIGSVAVALLLWYGGGQIVTGTLTFGALVAFLEYTNRFFLPIRDLGAKYAVMQAAMASSERIFGLLDVAPAIESPNGVAMSATPARVSLAVTANPETLAPSARPAVTPSTAAGAGGGGAQSRVAPPPARDGAAGADAPTRPRRPGEVELRRVWFAYEGEQWVLRDCSLRIAPGERVALVGVTGAGKTTIARLLNRSYDVARGDVLVDGVDVRRWDLRALRRRVGIVQQDTTLFTGTIEANLRLAAGADVSRREVETAAAAANAHHFIAALPHGYAHEISERGSNLSQGERQRLAIARALVYNPAVLVLDEATSSVDAESEQLIQEAMTRLLAGRTSLIIAHRFSTIQGADRILVLHRGRVHEEGRHAELLRRGGLYARLCEVQFGPRLV
jgi:ATP-binding cassette, subfamily B, multidrug efflux pump